MILRPVRPASPTGPPITNLPVGLTRKPARSSPSSNIPGASAASTGSTTCCQRSGLIVVSDSTPSACWVEIRSFSIADRTAVGVADGDLGLAVGAEVGERLVLAHRGEPLGQPVGEVDRHRHQRLGLVAGVAEHHPLVACAGDQQLVVLAADPGLVGGVDALGDVGRLLVERDQDRDVVAVVAVVAVVVADAADRLADDLGDVEVDLGRDLAGDDRHAGVDQRLAGDPALRVLGHDRVEDAVGDLVADLVRMALGDRLGGEQVLALGERLCSHGRKA